MIADEIEERSVSLRGDGFQPDIYGKPFEFVDKNDRVWRLGWWWNWGQDNGKLDPYAISWMDQKTGEWAQTVENTAGCFFLGAYAPFRMVEIFNHEGGIVINLVDGRAMKIFYVGGPMVYAVKVLDCHVKDETEYKFT
jgi:hypothetical protein